jgi:hypothetical protein
MLPAIKDALTTKSFAVVAADYGVVPQSIINFLNRHGVDHKQFKKKKGKQRKTEDDGWPDPVKPQRKMSLVSEVQPPAEQPKMKFKTTTTIEKRKGRWGEYDYPTTETVAEPQETYTDPTTGKKVTKYPPGYAFNAHPQRNIRVKGGA